jgi:hypothetical protein
MSVAIVRLLRSAQAHAFGQLFRCNGETHFVLAWIGDQSQPVKKTQGLEYCSVDADTDGVVTLFDTPKRWATGKGPFGDYLGWQASTATGVAYVESELAERPPSSD